MNKPTSKSERRAAEDFEEASQQPSESLLREFGQFIIENKAWWMIPIVVCLGLLGIVIVLASTGAAPFIYTLF